MRLGCLAPVCLNVAGCGLTANTGVLIAAATNMLTSLASDDRNEFPSVVFWFFGSDIDLVDSRGSSFYSRFRRKRALRAREVDFHKEKTS